MKNFTTHPVRVLALALLAAALLASCSMARFGYSHGESLSYWWLNSYIDVEPEQRPWVKERIRALFAWHRATQLQDTSRLFADTQQQLAQPVTTEQVLASYDKLTQRAWLVIEKALPDLADLALALTPHQIAHLEQKFATNNDKYRKDHLHRDIDHRHEHRFKKLMKQAEYWLGDFDSAQQAALRQASDARPLNSELWMKLRLQRQQELLAMLKKIQSEKPPREEVIAMLRGYARAAFEPGANPHKDTIVAARRQTAALVAQVVNQASPKQKSRAVRTLQKWIDDFRQMAAQA